jgi:hypothetical protein
MQSHEHAVFPGLGITLAGSSAATGPTLAGLPVLTRAGGAPLARLTTTLTLRRASALATPEGLHLPSARKLAGSLFHERLADLATHLRIIKLLHHRLAFFRGGITQQTNRLHPKIVLTPRIQFIELVRG